MFICLCVRSSDLLQKPTQIKDFQQVSEALYLFFSSSSELTLFLNLGSSCCRSSFTPSLSCCCWFRPLGWTKWKVLAVPSCSTTCSCTFSLVSGEIFWTGNVLLWVRETLLKASLASVLTTNFYSPGNENAIMNHNTSYFST